MRRIYPKICHIKKRADIQRDEYRLVFLCFNPFIFDISEFRNAFCYNY